MAGPGFTFVEAINEVVETIGEFPMSGATKPSGLTPPDTTSIYARAEEFIDRYNKRVQSQGFPENTVFGKAYTPNGSDNNNVDLATTVLRIQSSGPSEHRTLVLRVDTSDSSTPKIFDARLNSFDLGSTSTVFVDQVDLLAFEDLTPHLQDVIIGMAKVAFQRRMQGNLNMDTALMQEYAQAEAQIERNIADISSQPFNQRPMVPGMGQPQQQRER
ncbi:MAG: hypothetical protein CMB34_06710 [Euryarchaeota archaeon]|nr:hypothetical protein [Euryarchaeota archaeon]|tara:strand:- start:188 stop:835 length:648 start_codon:yes stop_codon:yes gene_type:complete